MTFFHFQIVVGDKVVIDSQDKRGLRGFNNRFRAEREAKINAEPLTKQKVNGHIQVFPVEFEHLPENHPAILLAADLSMVNEEPLDIDFSRLHVSDNINTEYINQ
jgi:hypothetical protein